MRIAHSVHGQILRIKISKILKKILCLCTSPLAFDDLPSFETFSRIFYDVALLVVPSATSY